jgi:hypothetical protein
MENIIYDAKYVSTENRLRKPLNHLSLVRLRFAGLFCRRVFRLSKVENFSHLSGELLEMDHLLI